MNLLEQQARRAWQRNAAWIGYGRCQHCGRTRDPDGALMLVVRQRRARKRLCIDCWEELLR